MPTGFATPSGKELPEKLKALVDRFAADLKEARGGGRVTPEKPICSRRLIEAYGKKGHEINVPRRASNGEPLARREADGRLPPPRKATFGADTPGELAGTLEHLEDGRGRDQRGHSGDQKGVRAQ
jgi:hypothetical protein